MTFEYCCIIRSMRTAAYYRNKAEESRTAAENARDERVKADLMHVAEQYDKLTKDAERQNG